MERAGAILAMSFLIAGNVAWADDKADADEAFTPQQYCRAVLSDSDTRIIKFIKKNMKEEAPNKADCSKLVHPDNGKYYVREAWAGGKADPGSVIRFTPLQIKKMKEAGLAPEALGK